MSLKYEPSSAPSGRSRVGAGTMLGAAGGRYTKSMGLLYEPASERQGRSLSTRVVEAYQELVAVGEIRADAAQEKLGKELDVVVQEVEAREGVWRFTGGRIARLLAPRAKGMYIYGGVGIGKSLMMDLFFEQLQVERKRRTHFHSFMLDVHRRAALFRKSPGYGGDVFFHVGRMLARETSVLCFDELQVCPGDNIRENGTFQKWTPP